MGSGEVAIVALSTMISLKVTFSDGLGGVKLEVRNRDLWFMGNKDSGEWTKPAKSSPKARCFTTAQI